MRKRILIGVGALAALIAALWVAGAMLPQEHTASREALLHAPPERVWEAITDAASFPQWRPDIKSVDLLPAADGRPAWVEDGASSRLLLEVVEAVAPQRLVTRIADSGLPFGGTWTYELRPEGEGTRLTITEHGEVYNPIFRLLARYVFGHGGSLEQYLTDLGRRFGQDVRF